MEIVKAINELTLVISKPDFINIALLLVTALYFIATVGILFINRRSLDLVKEQMEAQAKPNIIFGFYCSERTFNFVAKNDGLGVAENLKIQIDKLNDWINIYHSFYPDETDRPIVVNMLLELNSCELTLMPKQEIVVPISIVDSKPYNAIISTSPILVSGEYSWNGKVIPIKKAIYNLQMSSYIRSSSDDPDKICSALYNMTSEIQQLRLYR